jgi:CheY-like chemotaxis protein
MIRASQIMAATIGYNKTPDSTAVGQRAPVREEASKARVLLVEDHEDTRFMMRTMLEIRGGISVVEAEDGVTAIALAESIRPDIILIDGSLPLLDGLSATRRIRELSSNCDVPIVFISGHALPDFEAQVYAAGCTDFLVKPFTLSELDRVLERHLST